MPRRAATPLLALALLLLAPPASALLLDRADFDGIDPFDFADYPDMWTSQRQFDFGPFVIDGYWGTDANSMPIAPPVVLPTVGGDGIEILLNPPAFGFGMDFGSVSGQIQITFLGQDDVLLAEYVASEFAGPGPAGFQGFLGFADDKGRMVYRVLVGTGECYLDNIFLQYQPIEARGTSWGAVRNVFR